MRWLRFWAIINAAIVCLLIGAALFGEDGVVRHERLSEELRRVRSLNDDFQTDNERLKLEVGALRQDDDYVEHVIRDELGYVKSDEVVFIFPTDKKAE